MEERGEERRCRAGVEMGDQREVVERRRQREGRREWRCRLGAAPLDVSAGYGDVIKPLKWK